MSFSASLICGFNNFYLLGELKTHLLDKQRHYEVASIAHERLASLAKEWKNLGIHSHAQSFDFAAKTILYSKMVTTFSIYALQKINLQRGKQAVQFLDNGINEVINHSEPMMLAASATSYLAMLYFGFYIPGSIGLAGIALTFAKQNGYLPISLEQKFIPLRLVCRAHSLITNSQINPLLKYYLLFNLLCEVTDYFIFSRSSDVSFKHTLNKNRSLGDDRLKELSKKSVEEQKALLDASLFQVNSSSVHAAKLITLPNQNDCTPNSGNFEGLFSTIESYFPSLEISVSEGWGRLKSVLVHDKAPEDALPPNYEAFLRLMHFILQEVQKKGNTDPDGFKKTILELNEIGDACVEGWIHRLSALIDPKSNELDWMVHFFLAKLRGELINQAANDYLQQLPSGHFLPELLRTQGGLYGVHVQSDLHSIVYPRWRTEFGERERFTKGFTLPERCVHLLLPSDYHKSRTFLETIEIHCQMLYSYPYNTQFITSILEKTPKNYHAEALVDYIYDKIKPTYREVGCTREKIQEIDNEALQGWLSKISERLDEEDVSPFTYDTDVSALLEINKQRPPLFIKSRCPPITLGFGNIGTVKNS